MSLHELHPVAEGALPPARDFLTSAGFGGVAALTVAIILALIAFFAARRAAKREELQREQRDRHHQELREDGQRSAALDRCWQRLVWVVETAGIEPAANEHATLGLGPELALEMLRGLLRDAEFLGDDTLARSVTVYLNQFSLVLAQQAGPLSQLGGRQSPPRRDAPAPREARETKQSPPVLDKPPATNQASAPTEDVTAEPAAKGRRRHG